VNNDGWMDIYLTNLWANILLLNEGNGTFSNISESANVEDLGMGWGTTFLDYDNDGWQDIYVANDFGFNPTFPYYNVLYRNLGDETFTITETGEAISNEQNSYGTAILDYNLDGNLDILVANKGDDMGVQLLENADRPQHWIGLKLIGTDSNRDAIGAKISVTDNVGNTFYRELTAGCSWSSQNTILQHIGVGSATEIDNVTIDWPAGTTETFSVSEIDQFYTITEGEMIVEGLQYGGTTAILDLMENQLPLSIFPNPNDGNFQLTFTTQYNSTISIELLNALGQTVFTKKIKQPTLGENVLFIQTTDLPAGIHTLQVSQATDARQIFIDIK